MRCPSLNGRRISAEGKEAERRVLAAVAKQVAKAAPFDPSLVGLKLAFTVPGSPVPKARARVHVGENGEPDAKTPIKTRRYAKTIREWAHRAVLVSLRAWPLSANYAVRFRVYRQRDQGDGDNFEKALWDACHGILWNNDGKIRKWSGEMPKGPDGWGIDKANPRLEVEVEVIG